MLTMSDLTAETELDGAVASPAGSVSPMTPELERSTGDNVKSASSVSRCLLKLGVDAHHARVTVGDLLAIRVFWEKVSIF